MNLLNEEQDYEHYPRGHKGIDITNSKKISEKKGKLSLTGELKKKNLKGKNI